jgi:hypothetical protein
MISKKFHGVDFNLTLAASLEEAAFVASHMGKGYWPEISTEEETSRLQDVHRAAVMLVPPQLTIADESEGTTGKPADVHGSVSESGGDGKQFGSGSKAESKTTKAGPGK